MKAIVNNSCCQIFAREKLTRGTVGKTMEAEFSADWDGLAITAVFEAGDIKKDSVFTGDPIVIPHEVLATAGVSVMLGFHGALPDGTIVKRTEKEWINNVSETLDPAGVPSTEPTPDWTAQVQKIATEAKEVADSVRSDADAGKFKGDKGDTGAAGRDGKSAYTYAVEGGYTGTESEFAAKLAAEIPVVDATLTHNGQAADAKAVGDAINSLSEEIAKKANNVYIGPVQPTDGTLYWLDTSDSGGSGGETVTHTVTATLTNVTIDNTAESVIEGASFAAALTADEGYTLSNVSVTMGGVDITNTVYANGNIYIASVTGDIVITAVAIEMAGEVTVYTITNNLLHATSDNPTVSVEENAAYTAKLTAETDYALDTVTVTMGGVDITSDVYADGVINIPAVTGDVVITATTMYSPFNPIYALAEPVTFTPDTAQVDTGCALTDEDKDWTIAITFNGSGDSGSYVVGVPGGINIRGQGQYYWFAGLSFNDHITIGHRYEGKRKAVMTHKKGSAQLVINFTETSLNENTSYTFNGGVYSGKTDETVKLGTAAAGTVVVSDCAIYARVLTDEEINAYLGVE